MGRRRRPDAGEDAGDKQPAPRQFVPGAGVRAGAVAVGEAAPDTAPKLGPDAAWLAPSPGPTDGPDADAPPARAPPDEPPAAGSGDAFPTPQQSSLPATPREHVAADAPAEPAPTDATAAERAIVASAHGAMDPDGLSTDRHFVTPRNQDSLTPLAALEEGDMASSAFPPPDVALSLTPTGPELEPRPPQEWPIQRDSEKSNGQGFLSAWDDKARQAHKDVLPPGGLSTGTQPKSVLNSKVLTAMGIVPGPFEHPIEPKDMLESIEAVVQLILYDSSEPKEEPHFTAGSWLSTCFTVRGRVPVLTSPVWQFIAVVNVGLFFVLEWVGKNEEVEKSKASTFFETVLTLEFTPLRLMSVGLMFLLIFRTQSAYQKWNVARKEWASVTLACRDVAMNVCTYNRDLYAVLTMCRYLLLFVISLRYWLRETPISHDLLGQLATPKLKRLLRSAEQEQDLVGVSAPRRRLLSDDRLSFQFKNVCYPLMMMEGIRALLNVSVEQGAMPPFHGSIEQSTKVMGTALCRMEAVQDTELPFAYVVHIRTTTILFFLIAPVFLVHPEDGLGWFGLVFTLGFAAILLGLENLAEELSNPFGLDSNDLPSDLYTCNLARDIGDAVRRRLAREDALSGAGSASPGGAGTLDLPTGKPAEPPAL